MFVDVTSELLTLCQYMRRQLIFRRNCANLMSFAELLQARIQAVLYQYHQGIVGGKHGANANIFGYYYSLLHKKNVMFARVSLQ